MSDLSDGRPSADLRNAPAPAHVCFLTSSAPLGPGDSYSPFILDLAAQMKHRGYRITILMPHVRGSATRETLRGVTIRRYRYLPFPSSETLGLEGGMLPGLRQRKLDVLKAPFLLWGQGRALRALHAEDPIHLLHSHWLIPQAVIGGHFARSRKLPHIGTAHGSDLLGLRFPGMNQVLRYAVRRSRFITVNSGTTKQELRARTSEGDVRIIPIGARAADSAVVEGNLELRRSLPEGEHVLGFVGRVVEEKGVLEFLRVVAMLRDDGVSAVGLVVGGGSAESDTRTLARKLAIEESVRFVGEVAPERVPEFMSVMDVLVVPSHYEAQGLVAIEAMLLGVPVVAFATGGLREVVVNGQTGLAVDAGDVDALAGATRKLLRDLVLRERLGSRAREVAVERFTLAAAAERFDGVYRSLLAP